MIAKVTLKTIVYGGIEVSIPEGYRVVYCGHTERGDRAFIPRAKDWMDLYGGYPVYEYHLVIRPTGNQVTIE